MKNLVLVTAFSSLWLLALSQKGSNPYFRAGYNLTTLSSEFLESSPRHGFAFNLGLYGNVSDQFKILTEIGFRTAGAKTVAQIEVEPDSWLDEPTYENIDYEQFSGRFTWNGLLGYEIIDEKLLAYGGVNLSFFGFPSLIDNNYSYVYNGQQVTTTSDMQRGITGGKVSPYLVVGADYGTKDYRISIRYNYGVFNREINSSEGSFKINSSAFQISFIYILSDISLIYSLD